MKETKQADTMIETILIDDPKDPRKPGRPAGAKNIQTIKNKPLKLTPQLLKRFLRRVEKTGNVSSAAAACGISRDAVYKRSKIDIGFTEAIERAKGRYLDMLEEEALKRAVEGADEAVYHKGQIVGYKKRYSDKMLDKLLTAADRERYGNNSVNHTTIDQNININSGDSAKDKLAAFFGLKDVTPVPEALEDKSSIDADYSEYDTSN